MTASAMAGMASDFRALAELKGTAARNQTGATEATAREFEALFVQIMVKAMRQTVGKGLLSGPQAEVYQEMYDQQIARQVARDGGIGIAEMLLKQWGVQGGAPQSTPRSSYVMRPVAEPGARGNTTGLGIDDGVPPVDEVASTQTPRLKAPRLWDSPEEFIARLRPAAEAAARKIGGHAEAILAVAAHETGFGQHVAGRGDGRSSFNLFGIKATPDWREGRVFASTLEFEGGVMQRKREPFRAYHSPAASVLDFADFLRDNPRYAAALEHAGNPQRFIQELQKAGYATDPDYARKVNAVMQRVQKMSQAPVPTADKNSGETPRNG